MLSVIIPTLDAAATIELAVRRFDAAHGLAVETIVADGGSTDGTVELAAKAGAMVVRSPAGRGVQIAAGAAAARGPWLLVLHADTRLGEGWERAVSAFIADPENERRGGYFRFALDDGAPAARRLERLVSWRCRALRLPYGDQGLLISRALYDETGGYRPLPLMEDVDLVRRLRGRLVALDAPALTSAARYRRDGYWLRPLRNLVCLALYYLKVPPRLIARIYG